MKKNKYSLVLVLGAVVGFIASFLQLLEKLTLLKNSQAVLTCNINSVFSCSNVLNAWQSSVFGFPNSLMCIIFFTFMVTLGLVLWSGGVIERRFRLIAQGIALFFLGFGVWFLEQSTFVIGSLCIFCIFCFAGLLAINAMWLRLNVNDLPVGKGTKKYLSKSIEKNNDIYFWLLLGLAVGAVMFLRFY